MSPRTTRTLLLVVGAGSCFLSLGLLALWLGSYEFCVRLTRLATGSPSPLNPAAYAILRPRLLPGALFYGLLGSCSLLFRGRLAAWFAEALTAARRCLSEYWRSSRTALLTETRPHRVSLLIVMALGILLRLAYLGEPPRYDESATYLEFAGRSLFHVLTLYPAPNNHVLHSLLAWASCRIFGDSPQALRLPVLFAGVILIPLIYATARRFAGRNAGLFAAALVAVSGPLVLYSGDARGYMLQAVFFALMLNAALDLAGRSATGSWLLFTAAAIAGFWTAPTMLYAYLIAAGWLLWTGGWRMVRPLVIHGLVMGVSVVFLYMPIAIVSGPGALLWNPWVRPLPPKEFWAATQKFPAELFRFLHGGDPLLLPVAIIVGILVCLLVLGARGRGPSRLFLVLCLVVLITPLLQRIVPFPRVFVPLLPVYFIVAAAGWSILGERLREHEAAVAGAVLLLLFGGAWHLARSGYIEAARYFPESPGVVRFLAGELRACDRLIISMSAGTPLDYELKLRGVKYAGFSSVEETPARVLVATQRIDGVLPPRGNGLLDPSLLTVPGTLSEAKLPVEEFTQPRLIFGSGRGQVFELTRLSAGQNGSACTSQAMTHMAIPTNDVRVHSDYSPRPW